MNDNMFVIIVFMVGLAINHVGMERMFRSYERKTGRSFDRIRAITVGLYVFVVFAFSSML